jgi:uncharacterized protein (TIGR02246 family)
MKIAPSEITLRCPSLRYVIEAAIHIEEIETMTELTEQDVETIRGLSDTHFKAVLDNDPNAFLATCTDDIIFLPPDQAATEGRDACRAFLDAFPQPETFVGKATDVQGHGDLAFSRGHAEAKFPDGSTASFKFLAMHRRQSDGSWKMFRDMWNMNAPASG